MLFRVAARLEKKSFAFVFPLVVAALATLATASAQAGLQPTCSSLFSIPRDSQSERGMLVRKIRQSLLQLDGRETDAITNASRAKLIDLMGASDAAFLFGMDLRKWPIYVGTSVSGQIVTVVATQATRELKVVTYQHFDVTTKDYLARRKIDRAIEDGAEKPEDYESTLQWLKKNYPAFDRVVADFAKRSGLIAMVDFHTHELVMAVGLSAGGGPLFTHPWYVRGAALYDRRADRLPRGAISSEALAPFVEQLLRN